MKNKQLIGVLLVVFMLSFSLTSWFCTKKETKLPVAVKIKSDGMSQGFDSTLVESFYAKYPKLILYKKQVVSLYRKNQYTFIWYDKKGRRETADVIYNKINSLYEEGIQASVPYKETLDALFQKEIAGSNTDIELFLSNYYFYYTNKVIQGIDNAKTNELEWYLPRKTQSYVEYLDSLLIDPKLMDEKKQQIDQYYKLRTVLKHYREIEKKGGWRPIEIPDDFKSIKPGDSSDVVAKIRGRLFLTGDIATDSKNRIYGHALQEAVLKYKKRNGFAVDKIILSKHIQEMNVPVSDRIKTIMVNMERCRWIPSNINKAKEFIVVNIPSYRLTYFKNEKPILISNVVVGNTMNKTVIFSGEMSHIVFAPYWNIPQSIIKNEILPAMEKDKNYLAKKNMEWNGGNVRQKPGPNNSLGLVKFLFPNTNNIYLHDTPAKELFKEENRAFSHGCIRVAKPVELANLILENDPNWSPEKIKKAMNRDKEKWYTLQNKIPVYIGYFTAWVNDDGTVNFYRDIYDRDNRLASMLIEE